MPILIPDIMEMLLSLFVIGVVSSGITEILKLACQGIKPAKDSGAVWWLVTFRTIPISLGIGMGNYFFPFPWGVSIGASAGVLSVLLYSKSREFLKNMVNPLNRK